MTSTSKRWNQIRFHDRIVKFWNFVFPQIDILERDVLKQNLRSFLTSWWIQRTQIKIGFKVVWDTSMLWHIFFLS